MARDVVAPVACIWRAPGSTFAARASATAPFAAARFVWGLAQTGRVAKLGILRRPLDDCLADVRRHALNVNR